MRNFLNNLRQRHPFERKMIARIVSGIVVAIIFTVWATGLGDGQEFSPVSSGVIEVSPQSEQASVFESVRRKATLLFGGGNNLFSGSVEYKKEEIDLGEPAISEEEEDLRAIFEAFEAKPE